MDAEKDAIDLGTFDCLSNAARACYQAAILLYGDDAQTYFDRRSPRVAILPTELLRYISVLKESRQANCLGKIEESWSPRLFVDPPFVMAIQE